jgi:Spx/MgsR family transcriptional regulator
VLTLYGLKNCETCRKAQKWLSAKDIDYRFFDIRADGLTQDRIEDWVAALGWEVVLNRRSTTWRGLSEGEREGLDDAKTTALMAAHPTLIKRPVIEANGATLIGFNKDTENAIEAAAG